MILIPVEGPIEKIEIEKDEAKQLEQLQKLVGGYIERIKFRPLAPFAHVGGRKIDLVNPALIVDEDGRQKNLPYNLRASMMAQITLVGPVLVVEEYAGKKPEDGVQWR